MEDRSNNTQLRFAKKKLIRKIDDNNYLLSRYCMVYLAMNLFSEINWYRGKERDFYSNNAKQARHEKPTNHCDNHKTTASHPRWTQAIRFHIDHCLPGSWFLSQLYDRWRHRYGRQIQKPKPIEVTIQSDGIKQTIQNAIVSNKDSHEWSLKYRKKCIKIAVKTKMSLQ